MKKVIIIISLILIVTVCFGVSSILKKDSGNIISDSKKAANENYFTWSGTIITGYTEEGLKQKHLTIPASCTEFSWGALDRNENVETISFETEKVTLGEYLFSDCTALKQVEFPVSVGNELPSNLFRGCVSLVNVNIPDSVTIIDEKAFYGCDSLETVSIPNKVTSIGEKAFYDCDNLKLIEIPQSVSIIKESAFAFCPMLKSVTFQEGVTTIEESAFQRTGIEKLEIPSSVTSIGKKAFYMCDSLVSVKILEGVTHIEQLTFSTCALLNELYIPSSVTSISSMAFTQFHSIKIYVKQGSYADTAFDEYNDGFGIKKYY